MSITVGLDFGTHQTKVCIENAANPAQKIYEFFEFEDSNGTKTVLFPSIVQINLDDTVSYGFVDELKCKLLSKKNIPPFIDIPSEPLCPLPDKPATIPYTPKPGNAPKPKKPLLKNIINLLNIKDSTKKSYRKWEEDCRNIDEVNEANLSAWETQCAEINEVNIKKQKQHDRKRKAKYAEYLDSLRSNGNKFEKMSFRYFKIASFYNVSWEHEIKPEIISVWYLTYVLFKIQNVFGQDFYTQMGIPSSIEKKLTEKQENTAYKILLAANHLIRHYINIENYLGAKYTELLQHTHLINYSQKDLDYFGINIIPEAFAGLLSVTQQGKLGRGLHLLIDIGGGTTDVALFTINKDKPNIHIVSSFNQGLNYIFRVYLNSNPALEIEQVQELFMTTQRGFENAIDAFCNKTNDSSIQIITKIKEEFNKKPHGHDISKLWKAMQDQPIVYCGGGAMYPPLRIQTEFFNDVKLINKEYLNIPYIKNENIDEHIYTILATSYGLSIQQEEKLQMTDITELFDNLQTNKDKEQVDWRMDHQNYED